MKRKICASFCAFFVLATGLFAQETLDKIVAIVDDNIILKSELYQFSYSLALQLGIDPEKEQEKFEQLLQETLNNLITQKILLVKAREDSVVVSDQQIDQALDQQINSMVRQLGSEQRVEEYFGGTTLRQIRRDFRDEVEERLLVERLKQQKDFEVKISRREVEDFFNTYKDSIPDVNERVKISHILVKVEPSEAAVRAAREKALMIKSRLDKGESFAELAKQYSEDPGSASRGGDLGMMERGDLVKEFEEVAFALEPGQISDIVRTRFGLHIIQLIRKAGEKINTRHILIRLDTSEEDERRTVEKLEDLRARIIAGEITFEEAASKYSKDETSANKGGDLGWFDIEQFQVPAFKEAIVGLKPGDLAEPKKTQFGYHLIRLDERKPARKIGLEQDWEKIEGIALNMKRRREFEKLIDDYKKDVYIEIK
ncbi:MAG: peptidylprolyl isomerase [bacterium]